MRPCDKCLDNNWRFEKLDGGYIRATCNGCGYEVEWQTKKKQVVRPIKNKINIKEVKAELKSILEYSYDDDLFLDTDVLIQTLTEYILLNYKKLK